MASSTSNINLRVPGGDDAPPPYSETDIYSTTSHSRSHSRTHSQPSHSPISATGTPFPGAVDDTASRISSSSTTGDVIFTPPLTPRTNNAFPDVLPSPSAALYIDDRPAPPLSPRPDVLVHVVKVQSRSAPDDLPYQPEWASRDVTVQDWATFVNFLLPDHDATTNEAILGEKAELSEKSSAGATERPNEDAQQRRREIEVTIQQWNDGFFSPRGINVQLDPNSDQVRMPGSWDTRFDSDAATEREAEASSSQVGPSQASQPGPSTRAGPSTQWGGWGRNFGGLQFGADSIRWGDKFVADCNGLRIGNLVMDNNGIRMDGARGPPMRNRGGPPQWQPWGWQHQRWQHHGHPGHPGPPNFFAGPPGACDRGRPVHPHQQESRSRSSSTSSSSSSNSSASSVSIGSLPDYDDLRDQQLPPYIARLQSWTAHPDQMRTKAEVKQLKTEIKASKSSILADGTDTKVLRAQIKELTQQWRQLKRQQKKARRDRKRERKQRRRAERKERRQQKREMKRAERDNRKGRNPPPQCGPGPQINIPPIHVPPIPAPQVNVPPPFAGQSWGRGWGGRRGRGCDRGGFFGARGPFGRDGPLGERGPLGPDGPLGRNGPLGPNGPLGEHGPLGPNGPLGRNGPLGPNGPLGEHGPLGPNGPLGRNGPLGQHGTFSSAAPNGPAGSAAAPQGPPNNYPGSWPEETPSDFPPPGPASAEKYRAAALIENEIAAKTMGLEAPEVGDSERKAMEKEIEALVEKLENMFVEADEAYARELAAHENQ